MVFSRFSGWMRAEGASSRKMKLVIFLRAVRGPSIATALARIL
jgi:hypothetical protein